jgi:hypothetical protein
MRIAINLAAGSQQNMRPTRSGQFQHMKRTIDTTAKPMHRIHPGVSRQGCTRQVVNLVEPDRLRPRVYPIVGDDRQPTALIEVRQIFFHPRQKAAYALNIPPFAEQAPTKMQSKKIAPASYQGAPRSFVFALHRASSSLLRRPPPKPHRFAG